MNYLDKEQKQKMEKIFNLQNSIEASKEKQEERISSYNNYLNTNMKNKTEELKKPAYRLDLFCVFWIPSPQASS